MLNYKELNVFFENFTNSNLEEYEKKQTLINDFVQKSQNLKAYNEVLLLLEQYEKDIDFSYFPRLREIIIQKLSSFDPSNMEYNLGLVSAAAAKLNELKLELNEILTLRKAVEVVWIKFLERNEKYKTSSFNDIYLQRLGAIDMELESMDENEMGRVSSMLSNFREDILKYIDYLNKLSDLINLNVFIGPEAERIKYKLEETLNSQLSEHEEDEAFFDQVDKLIFEFEETKSKSVTSTVPVPVFKVYSESNPEIYKNTIKFADYLVKYDSFFKNENLKEEFTGKYMYFENFPKNGIFLGSDIVMSFGLDENYKKANDLLEKKSKAYIVWSLVFIIVLFLLQFVLPLKGYVIFFAITSASLIGLLPFFLRKEKKKYEKKWGLKKMFLFNPINILIHKDGDFLDLKDIYVKTIQKIDETILNKNYHDWLRK